MRVIGRYQDSSDIPKELIDQVSQNRWHSCSQTIVVLTEKNEFVSFEATILDRIAALFLGIIGQDYFSNCLGAKITQTITTFNAQKPAKKNLSTISATFNQYTYKNGIGRSACTPISVRAVTHFLTAAGDFTTITADHLDRILIEGIELYTTIRKQQEHLSVGEVPCPATIKIKAEHSGNLSPLALTYQGSHSSYQALLETAIDSTPTPFALVLTKAPETVSLLVKSPQEIWIFDSHRGGTNHAASLKKFSSMQSASGCLNQYLSVDRELLNDPDMLDLCSFEATIFVPNV